MAELLDTACTALGLHPFPTPRGVNSHPYNGRPACSYCDLCAGFGCASGARGSTQESVLAMAERTGRCEILANAMVREINVRSDGRVDGCTYLDEEGHEHKLRSRIVCVCCSAVESARLLLLSRSPLFPNGLANGSGLVGRFLQFHANSGGAARFRHDRHPSLNLKDRNHFLGRSIMDHYILPSGISDFPKGGMLRFDLSTANPIARAQTLARDGSGMVVWGNHLKRRIREYFHDVREVEFEVFHDFIANKESYVELDSSIQDKWKLPVAKMHRVEIEHQKTAGKWLADRGLETLEAMGADELRTSTAGKSSNFLLHGTCRAGKDPKKAVLTEFCQAHEVPNLFVVDGSFMPTCGGVPPTLTIMANSFRTADYILLTAKHGTFN